jgi:hypothetical protein
VREENCFVSPVVEYTDVAVVSTGAVARKHQKQP